MTFVKQCGVGVIGCLVTLLVLGGCAQSFEKEPQPRAETPAPRPQPVSADGRKVVYAFPSGDPRTSVALLEKWVPSEVQAGNPFDFTLTVINTSDVLCLDDVVVEDILPAGMKLESATPAPQASGSTLTWKLGRIDPKQTVTIKARATVSDAGTIQQCATLTCTPKACVDVIAVKPALRLVKTAPAEVLICDDIPIKLVVTNTGSGVARGVTVTDSLPTGLATADGKSTVSVAVGDLGPNQSKEITYVARASKTGRYEGPGAASATGGLKADSNATATVVKQPVLELTKKALQEKVLVGRGTGTFTHEITIKNTGDGVAANTIITDTPPAGVTVVKADGAVPAAGKLQWNAGDLRPGESKTMQITFSTAAAGTYVNNVTAAARCANPVNASARTEVSGIPAVLLEMADDPDPVKIGDLVTYTIVVTNQGSADDTNIVVVCNLTDEMQFVSCGPKSLPGNQPPGTTERFTQISSTAGRLDGKQVKFDTVPRLGAKQYVVWEVKVRATKAKDVRFDVTLTTEQTKAGGEIKKNESTRFYE
jgi:uncharacterized repeat protein (TIGR01451 family)